MSQLHDGTLACYPAYGTPDVHNPWEVSVAVQLCIRKALGVLLVQMRDRKLTKSTGVCCYVRNELWGLAEECAFTGLVFRYVRLVFRRLSVHKKERMDGIYLLFFFLSLGME